MTQMMSFLLFCFSMTFIFVLIPSLFFYWSYRQKKYYEKHPEIANAIARKAKERREREELQKNISPNASPIADLLSKLFVTIVFLIILAFAYHYIGSLIDRGTSVNVDCYSYNGKTHLRAMAFYKNNPRNIKIGLLSLDSPETGSIQTELNENISYTDSQIYAHAIELRGSNKDISLTLMSDDIHGLIYLPSPYYSTIPVICYTIK